MLRLGSVCDQTPTAVLHFSRAALFIPHRPEAIQRTHLMIGVSLEPSSCCQQGWSLALASCWLLPVGLRSIVVEPAAKPCLSGADSGPRTCRELDPLLVHDLLVESEDASLSQAAAVSLRQQTARCSEALADFLLCGAPSASITAIPSRRGTSSCLPVLASCPCVSLSSTWEDLMTCPTSTCWPVVPSRMGIQCA